MLSFFPMPLSITITALWKQVVNSSLTNILSENQLITIVVKY
jgi:hypothetical protein